jgi:hypothetical protein
MKKILSIALSLGFVLAFGVVYASTEHAFGNGAAIVDRTSLPGYVDPETGVANRAGEATIFAASGGSGMEADTHLSFIDQTSIPGYVDSETGAVVPAIIADNIARGAAAGGMSMEPDTHLKFIDPSSVPGYVDPETGAVTR